MEYHLGRLVDHIHLHVVNLEASRQFYLAILTALRKSDSFGGSDTCFYCDELYVDGDPMPTRNFHLAFQANSKEDVQRFYEEGIKAGGISNGKPGYRTYHKAYYAAFLIDPDGNNIEALYDVGSIRLSDSVVVKRNDDNA